MRSLDRWAAATLISRRIRSWSTVGEMNQFAERGIEALQDRRQALFLGVADEHDLAAAHILGTRDPPDHDAPVVDLLSTQRVVEDAPEGIAAEDGDDEGPVLARRVARPFDEPREVVQERRLDLVLRGAGGPREREEGRREGEQQQSDGPRQPHPGHKCIAISHPC